MTTSILSEVRIKLLSVYYQPINNLTLVHVPSYYMTMRYDPAKELSKSDAAVLVREIVETGTLILTRHVRERMQVYPDSWPG